MKKLEFINNNKLARAVINQIGGWKNFKHCAPDIANYGIDGGFTGFIYYTDTIKFYERNKGVIYDLLLDQAYEIGETVIDMMAGFNSLKGVSQDEILDFFTLGKEASEYTTIANALAWFAGEEIARRYADMLEG